MKSRKNVYYDRNGEPYVMYGPYSPDEIPNYKIDYRGMIAYARSQGKHVPDLSDEEMERFTYGVSMKEIREHAIKLD